ncbi:hypothetical protein [Actinomadura sp. BRA 177]|uniref:hypothetical protein n=1 Tax=Actinomadura sp. BRA 177 TaxID=2745202 RepID=UPI00159531CE|nr:hypothetical protein [Actinomadura sp. BRA 177]NVI87200.1 hypothetical protein [Actinomadura sp. BRA 177]
MNRSARSLLGAAAVAPFAAVLAVAAAPANAAPGPSTALLYDTAAAAYPATRTLPDPVVQTGGQTAEKVTGTVDGVLRAAPGTSRHGAARCKLNPGKTVNSETGAGMPETPLPAVGQTPLGGLPKGDCLGTRRAGARGADALPAPDRAAKPLLKDVRKAGDTVRNSKVGQVTGMRPAFPAGRRAGMPVSMALPADLPSVPGALRSAQSGGLPSVLFPVAGRRATPVPSDDVVGQANDTVNKAGKGLDRTEQGVGNVVDVLKAKDPAARPADGPLPGGPLSDGPLSMPDATALGLPALPGIG